MNLLEFSPLMALMAEEAITKVDMMSHMMGTGKRSAARRRLVHHYAATTLPPLTFRFRISL